MNTQAKRSKSVEVIGLLVIGALLLIVAVFVDPIGNSPDTGVFDLGSSGTKWLLGTLGGLFIVGGIGTFIRARSSR